ncbi:MAG: nuclear transport factor 2 family protein [Acidimicrobiia bacterium]
MTDSREIPTQQASSDVAEIEAVARDYIEGWYAGDVERMDRALHAELVKRVPEGEEPDAFREVTKARMLELTAGGGGDAPDPTMEIFVDDVSFDIATAQVLSPEYLDYLHLVGASDGWRIANVLFHPRS